MNNAPAGRESAPCCVLTRSAFRVLSPSGGLRVPRSRVLSSSGGVRVPRSRVLSRLVRSGPVGAFVFWFVTEVNTQHLSNGMQSSPLRRPLWLPVIGPGLPKAGT